MLEAVIFYWRFLKLEKEKSSTKSADFYEASGALPSPLWKLFEIDKLMNLIKIYDKNLNLIDSYTCLDSGLKNTTPYSNESKLSFAKWKSIRNSI